MVGAGASQPRLIMRPFSGALPGGNLAAQGAHVLCGVGVYRLDGPDAQYFALAERRHAGILGLSLVAFLRDVGLLWS